jgi:hypothetical protein
VTQIRDHRLPDRFWDKVQTSGTGCWIWTGAHFTSGYGSYSHNGQCGRAHRIAYRALVGEVPEGLDLDHLCRIRDCVNPNHLEPVTRRVNALRGASPLIRAHLQQTCLRGHAYEGNRRTSPGGTSYCKPCARENHRAWKARRAA